MITSLHCDAGDHDKCFWAGKPEHAYPERIASRCSCSCHSEPSKSVFQLWPEVSRWYQDCRTDEERLKQRIRRAFEKNGDEQEYFAELAHLLFVKIMPSIEAMKTTVKGDL